MLGLRDQMKFLYIKEEMLENKGPYYNDNEVYCNFIFFCKAFVFYIDSIV